jgi:hypothetical protein
MARENVISFDLLSILLTKRGYNPNSQGGVGKTVSRSADTGDGRDLGGVRMKTTFLWVLVCVICLFFGFAGGAFLVSSLNPDLPVIVPGRMTLNIRELPGGVRYLTLWDREYRTAFMILDTGNDSILLHKIRRPE